VTEVSAALLAHAIAHPDERDAFLVLGDALLAAGDPRGELVIAQALGGAPEREAELIAAHRAAWLGPLATVPARELGLSWRFGYVRAVRLGPPRQTSRDIVGQLDFHDLIVRLARMPGNQLVDTLVVAAVPSGSRSWQRGIIAIRSHGLPPNLARLELLGDGQELGSRGAPLAPAEPALRGLRELAIAMSGISLTGLELPALRVLELAAAGFTQDHASALAAVEWPRLERLAIHVGVPGERGCNITPGRMRVLLESLRVPALRHLGLRAAGFTDELVAILATCPLARQLESLDLSGGTLSDAGAAELHAFAHLRELDASHAYLTPHARDVLAQLGPRAVLDDPQSPDDDFRRPREASQ
jgi:hypothetical protein